jgi:hypothetical protein
MKIMNCKQLGGACDLEFEANTFEEMAELSRKHGMTMVQKGDPEHLEAMNQMRELMQSPEDMQQWMEAKRQEFEALPDQ